MLRESRILLRRVLEIERSLHAYATELARRLDADPKFGLRMARAARAGKHACGGPAVGRCKASGPKTRDKSYQKVKVRAYGRDYLAGKRPVEVVAMTIDPTRG